MNCDRIEDLDPAATLAAVEDRVRARRTGEVADLLLVLQWCDLNSTDPQSEPGAVPASRGGDRLIQIGGDGTPPVAELCFAELAIARRAGMIATEHYAADCLDLRHRLPLLWAAVQRLEVEAWVARKVARDARRLARDRVGLVDTAVAAAVAESPGRLLEIAAAAIIEADPDAHRAKLEADAKDTGVWLSRVRPDQIVDETTGEPATRRVTAKISTGAAIRCEENVDDLAHALYDQIPPDAEGNRPSHAECRLLAFEMLTTDPHAAVAFLDELAKTPADPDPDTDPAPRPRRKSRPATIVVHLSSQTLCGCTGQPGIARVEDHGPILLDQLTDLLDGRDVLLQPVIDLNLIEAVNGYEHPTRIKQRTVLRTHGDVFPHTTSRARARLDHDHATPYVPGGAPGQTGDHNDAPLTRRHHRAKTHAGYQVAQLGLGVYRWATPHGLGRIVTPSGTRDTELLRNRDGTIVGETYAGPPLDFRYRE